VERRHRGVAKRFSTSAPAAVAPAATCIRGRWSTAASTGISRLGAGSAPACAAPARGSRAAGPPSNPGIRGRCPTEYRAGRERAPDTLQRLAVYHGKRARRCSATLRKLEHREIPGEFVRRAIQNYAAG